MEKKETTRRGRGREGGQKGANDNRVECVKISQRDPFLLMITTAKTKGAKPKLEDRHKPMEMKVQLGILSRGHIRSKAQGKNDCRGPLDTSNIFNSFSHIKLTFLIETGSHSRCSFGWSGTHYVLGCLWVLVLTDKQVR